MADAASHSEKESLSAREAELAVPCQEPERSALADGEGSAANVMQRYDLVELLRELTERVDGMSEPEITLGTGDDACVMDWHAFDGEFYRATIERIEP